MLARLANPRPKKNRPRMEAAAMSAAAEALRVARAAGVAVTSDGHHLSVAAPVESPADVIELLREHKPAIVELLRYDTDAWADAVTTCLDPARPLADIDEPVR